MISLELLVIEPHSIMLESDRVAFEIDTKNVSDRQPSLWQESIIDKSSGILIHFFDRSFKESTGSRWLYEDIDTEEWNSFRFKSELERDFIRILNECFMELDCSGAWLLSDAQYGPRAQKTEVGYEEFIQSYLEDGLRINMATLIKPDSLTRSGAVLR